MNRSTLLILAGLAWSTSPWAADYPPAQNPAIADGPGYIAIEGAAVPIEATRTYKAIIDAQTGASKPTAILPSLNRASSIMNALAVGHVPSANRKLVLVYHGDSVDGLLKNEGYRAKFGVDNPNLKVITELANAGVVLYVCGQYMAGRKLGIDELAPQVKLATAASLVLITYESDGYARLNDR